MDAVLISTGVATYFVGGAALLAIFFGIYNVNWVFPILSHTSFNR